MNTKRITKHIDDLLLDPNNYRFIDRHEYRPVLDDQVLDERVQQRTLSLIAGRNNENIEDLIASFTTNGFLDIDQIQTKAVGNKFLVLEGNRRIATLKILRRDYEKGNDVGKLNKNSFESINVVEITGGDTVQHLIAMGLHHISGKRKWSPVNEAQLMSDLLKKHRKSEDEICSSLGITKQKLRKSLRTLSIIEQYKESDYGDQFEKNMYSIFESVINQPRMREWVGWDDSVYEARNSVNRERFFSWISQQEETEKDESGDDVIMTKEPIITQYREIRDLAEFINDEKAIREMEKTRNIRKGYNISDMLGNEKFRDALDNVQNGIKIIKNYREYIKDTDYIEIADLKSELDKLASSGMGTIDTSGKTGAVVFASVDSHFDFLNIKSFRKLKDIRIRKLSRVNIFAGNNNSGKTSVLEAFYLLSQLNDPNALFGLERYRGKFYTEFQSLWLHRNLTSVIEISGEFNGRHSTLFVQNNSDGPMDIDKSGFLSTVRISACMDNSSFDTHIHLYGNKSPVINYTKTQILCRGALSSPYWHNVDLLSRAHNHAVREKYFSDIIDFIRENMDSSIERIEMTENSRFMVTSNRLASAIDITKYGEGLQRVFEIALLMGYNRNGILCIDEIDCALHKTLLVGFSTFIQKLSEKFNVQLFLSTHSKECIDAFIEAKYNDNRDITAYSLSERNGQAICKYVDGKRLDALIQSVNFDIR